MKYESASLLWLVVMLVAAAASGNARADGDPLRFHYADSGAPPWLYLAPGGSRPTGLVSDILEAVARESGRTVRYEFQPRESALSAIEGGSADGALFFSATRPAGKSITVTAPLLRMDSVLVTRQGQKLAYERPADLRDKRLCTLTEEIYPPLTLLALNGTLMQRRAKTEQAQLMMLRNEDCVAAILNGPMYHWLAARYHWNDLRVEPRPLLNEGLLLGFSARESAFAAAIDSHVRRMRTNGEFDALVARYLPGSTGVTTR